MVRKLLIIIGKRIEVHLLLTISLLAGLFLWYLSSLERVPPAAKRVAELAHGMTHSEVKGILGDPKSISASGEEWSYYEPGSWPIFTVHFDENDKLIDWKLDR